MKDNSLEATALTSSADHPSTRGNKRTHLSIEWLGDSRQSTCTVTEVTLSAEAVPRAGYGRVALLDLCKIEVARQKALKDMLNEKP